MVKRNNPKLQTHWWRTDKRKFERKLKGLLARVKDGRPAFRTIGKMFRQSRRTIFSLKSKGGYPDFKGGPDAPYPRFKERAIGKKYPLLFFSGKLKKSITNQRAEGNVTIIQKQGFVLGTKIPYAKYHDSEQLPRTKIPQRKFIFWGAESRKFQNLTGETRKFQGRAIKILRDYIRRGAENT